MVGGVVYWTNVDENMDKMRGASRALGLINASSKRTRPQSAQTCRTAQKGNRAGAALHNASGLAVIQIEGVLALGLRDHLLEERPNGAYKANWERSLF